ncbi:MAG: STAS domain-containing protein [Desulfobacterales bacterium]|nr:STAS domain-containing protein [Desulfobacterales bacterium]
MAINSQISADGKTLTITLSGRFEISAHKIFTDSYKDKIGSASQVVVDMADVEYIDSTALGMLLVLRQRAGGDKAKIDIVNSKPYVKNILSIAKFEKLFHIT